MSENEDPYEDGFPDSEDKIDVESTIKSYSRRMGDIHAQEQGTKIWLVSFTDVMALMLTFFVMLFAMSEPEQQSWSEISSALHNEFNKYYGAPMLRGPVEEVNLDRIDYDQALNIQYLSALLEAVMGENEYLKTAKIFTRSGELVISMPQELLFEAGSASIKEDGSRALYALGGRLSRIKNKIEVVGHADPRPISSKEGGFSSNWDLSLSRALSVAGLLNSVGYQKAIDIVGYGSGRYDDLDKIENETERLDIARRVDIVLKNHDGRKNELIFDPMLQ